MINIDLKDKPAWFLEKYQAGTVPVLEIDDKVIGESLITAEYIDEMYSKPGKQSLPTDPYKKAQARLLIYELGKVCNRRYLSDVQHCRKPIISLVDSVLNISKFRYNSLFDTSTFI